MPNFKCFCTQFFLKKVLKFLDINSKIKPISDHVTKFHVVGKNITASLVSYDTQGQR